MKAIWLEVGGQQTVLKNLHSQTDRLFLGRKIRRGRVQEERASRVSNEHPQTGLVDHAGGHQGMLARSFCNVFELTCRLERTNFERVVQCRNRIDVLFHEKIMV